MKICESVRLIHKFKMQEIEIVCLGDHEAKKTGFIIRYTRDKYDDVYIPSLEDNYSKIVKIDGKEYKVNFTDTSGQDDYASLALKNIELGDGFLLFYSVKSMILKN